MSDRQTDKDVLIGYYSPRYAWHRTIKMS